MLNNIINKIIKWVIFSVIVGLLPIGWNVLQRLTYGDNIILERLYGNGDLLLVGNAITAGAVGELFIHRNQTAEWVKTIKLVCGGSSVVILMVNSLWFSQINSYLLSEQTFDKNLVVFVSPILFLLNLISSLGCITSSEF